MESINNNVPQAAANTSVSTAAPKTGKKRPGKASRAKRSEEFRMRMNQRQYEAKRKEIEKHFLSDDELAAVEESLKSMRLTVQPRAIPMTVATRGVGFASAIEYSRMITTWNVEAIEVICSIHQYYRVNMFLMYYKLYLANREQGEMLSYPLEGVLIMTEEIRQIVAPICQIPIAMSNILHAAGKVEGEVTFHARMQLDTPQSGEQMAIYLNPTIMRKAVEFLSDPQNPSEERNRFHELNPIPGAIWVNNEVDGWLLQNPDQIWPVGYDAQQLSTDVHAYQNLLTRTGGRLPKSFLVKNTWSGKGSRSLTASFDVLDCRLQAVIQRFNQRTTTKRRAADGRIREVEGVASDHRYLGDQLVGGSAVIEVWSPEEKTTAIEMSIGAAAFIGEHVMQPPRLQIQGRISVSVSPGNVLQKLVDAPRV